MPPPAGYWEKIQAVLTKHDILLVADEVITGFGRLGTMYGFEAYGVVPDFLVLSKTLGGGIPIGAVVTSAAIEETCHGPQQLEAGMSLLNLERGVFKPT